LVVEEGCVANPSTIDGVADVDFSGDTELLLIGGFEGGGEGVAVGSFNEVDGAAAEASAGEASPEAAGEVGGGIDEKVDFFAAALEVVAFGGMAGEHELAKGNGVAGKHGLFGFADACVVGDDVAAAAESVLRHLGDGGLKLIEGGLAEVADAVLVDEDGLAFLGFAAAHTVFASGDRVFDHGVADDDLRVGEGSLIHGEVLVVQLAGIEEEGVAGLGGGDDELVHDAAGGVDVVVFGALGEEGDVFEGEGGAGEGEHGHGAGDFDGGGRTETSSEGDVAGEVQVEGWRLDVKELELAKDADGVVGPEAAGRRAVFTVEGDGVGEEVAGEAVEVVGTRGDGGVGGEGDRHGEDESASVVGMLPQEIDAGRSDAVEGLAGCSGRCGWVGGG
jgi:hypothetical protein